MTINIHEENKRLSKYLEDGYIEVGRKRYYDESKGKPFYRLEIAHPKDTCLRKMRTGFCLMDKDHRGRCSTVTFYCDPCGKTRRGSPHTHGYDSNGDVDIDVCWFCVRMAEKNAWKGIY